MASFLTLSCSESTHDIDDLQDEEPEAPDFPAPKSMAEVAEWEKSGKLLLEQQPGQPFTPRAFIAQTGPKYNVYSFKEAVDDLIADTKISFKAPAALQQLGAWERFDGRDVRIALVPTTYQDTEGVLFLYISKMPQSGLFGIEMTKKTFHEWGGIMQMLVVRDIVKSKEAFPEEYRKAIANASFQRQVAVYDAALNALYDRLSKSFITNQSQILLRLQELNYDLLLGDDITDPSIG